MAETIVTSLINNLVSALAVEIVKPLGSSLLRKALPSEKIDHQIDSIKREFELMRNYLREVDQKRDGNQLMEAWARHLRDLVYEVEDIVDEYTYLVGDIQRSGFLASLRQTSTYYANIKSWHSISSRLQQVNARIINLTLQKERYGIGNERTSLGAIERYRHDQGYCSSYFADEDEIVGFERYKDVLIGWLMEEEPQRRIISLWGMGGLGKTTLAMDVYKNQAIRRHFNCKAWVSISRMYTIDNVLRKVIKELFDENDEILPYDIDSMPIRRLEEVVQNFLGSKKYLVVLDDVWDAKVWFDIRTAFLDCDCASRIVLTTRNYNVAMLAQEIHIIELLPFSESDSWILFCKKAFWRDRGRVCPRELEYWARKIVGRCQGLPLAIVAIGRVTSLRVPTELEWRKVYEGLNWEIENNQMFDMVKNILNYSFKDLPYYLRSCFQYCSIFPEDYPIKRKRLIRLWVAEGFIGKDTGRTMEDVAEDHLDELVHRCMLQVFKRNNFGRVKLCRMHDVVRELTLSISQRENFCRVYNREDDDDGSIYDARRLSVQNASCSLQSLRGIPRVRSFFLFDTSNQSLWKSMPSRFWMLKVLDLEGVPIESVPKEVMELFNLRYLGLRKTKVRKLPRSLGRLQNLETLDLYDSCIERLPRGITRLKKLRHLFVESIKDPTFAELSSDPGVKAPKGIWKLTSLQTLQSVEADEEMVRNIRFMKKLRTLRITKVRGIHCAEFCSSLSKMSHLMNLDVAAFDEAETLKLEELNLQIVCHMMKLELRARLKGGVLPKWFDSLKSLRQLGLSWSGLQEDPLPCLGSLPNLAVLGLYKAYDGPKLCFKAGGFLKLNFLMLGGSASLDSVSIEEGAMPRLSELCMLRCTGMRLLPMGMEHLTTLKVLYLLEMPVEFVETIRHQEELVRHISTIKHVFQREGRWVSEILS